MNTTTTYSDKGHECTNARQDPGSRLPMVYGIEELQQQLVTDESIPMTMYIRESELIGLFDGKFAMFQNGERIFTLNWSSLLRELFYQCYLQKYGSYKPFVIPEACQSMKLSLDSFFEIIVRVWPEKTKHFTYRTTEWCIKKLMSHRSILRSQMLIDITDDMRLISLPILIEGHTPNVLSLGEFLARLANYVNYYSHGECIRLVGRVLADFYSVPMVPRTLSNIDAKLAWTDVCKTRIFPRAKMMFRVPRFFYEIGGIQFNMNTVTACRAVER